MTASILTDSLHDALFGPEPSASVAVVVTRDGVRRTLPVTVDVEAFEAHRELFTGEALQGYVMEFPPGSPVFEEPDWIADLY